MQLRFVSTVPRLFLSLLLLVSIFCVTVAVGIKYCYYVRVSAAVGNNYCYYVRVSATVGNNCCYCFRVSAVVGTDCCYCVRVSAGVGARHRSNGSTSDLVKRLFRGYVPDLIPQCSEKVLVKVDLSLRGILDVVRATMQLSVSEKHV